MRSRKQIQTDIALHPGDIILDELEARDIMKSAFAEQLGMKPSRFSKLLHGRGKVNAATAIKLLKRNIGCGCRCIMIYLWKEIGRLVWLDKIHPLAKNEYVILTFSSYKKHII